MEAKFKENQSIVVTRGEYIGRNGIITSVVPIKHLDKVFAYEYVLNLERAKGAVLKGGTSVTLEEHFLAPK